MAYIWAGLVMMLCLFACRFGGQFTEWGQPFRLRHVVTGKALVYQALCKLSSSLLIGRYLGTIEENDRLTLLASKHAKLAKTLFRFRQSLVSTSNCDLSTLIEQSLDNTKLTVYCKLFEVEKFHGCKIKL